METIYTTFRDNIYNIQRQHIQHMKQHIQHLETTYKTYRDNIYNILV